MHWQLEERRNRGKSDWRWEGGHWNRALSLAVGRQYRGILVVKIRSHPRRRETAHERLKGKSAKTQGLLFAEENLPKRRAGGPLGKPTCMGGRRAHGRLEHFGFTARCPGFVSILGGTERQAHTESWRRTDTKDEAAEKEMDEADEVSSRRR